MEDKTIICKDCGDSFIWSVKGQQFFKEKGFSSPVRCSPCRKAKKARQSGLDEA